MSWWNGKKIVNGHKCSRKQTYDVGENCDTAFEATKISTMGIKLNILKGESACMT